MASVLQACQKTFVKALLALVVWSCDWDVTQDCEPDAAYNQVLQKGWVRRMKQQSSAGPRPLGMLLVFLQVG